MVHLSRSRDICAAPAANNLTRLLPVVRGWRSPPVFSPIAAATTTARRRRAAVGADGCQCVFVGRQITAIPAPHTHKNTVAAAAYIACCSGLVRSASSRTLCGATQSRRRRSSRSRSLMLMSSDAPSRRRPLLWTCQPTGSARRSGQVVHSTN